jgi:glycosyltransferase involved in cell wall biosynthesis
MTKNFPLISIIVPTYNRSYTIERAVESILAQTYKHFEVIDGSTDDTLHVLEKYHKDKRIRIIKHGKNRGVTAAKNTGFII